MLQLDNIALNLGAFRLRMDLKLENGRRLGLLGPSGSGKSTILNLIAGFLEPDQGRVFIGGQDVTSLPVSQRPLSLLFQEGNLFPHLDVHKNVALGLRSDLRLTDTQRDAVAVALDQVGLAVMGDRMPGDLSGGQRSRVALARMLLREKPLVLLDEPFAALDPGLRREMLALVQELCEASQLTLVMVSHDLRDVEKLCTDLCLLEDGKQVLSGPLPYILETPPPALSAWL